MQCPTDDCESTEFDMAATAFMSLSTGDTPQEATGDLDGVSHEEVEITCKDCGTQIETTTAFDIAALVAIVRVTKELKLPCRCSAPTRSRTARSSTPTTSPSETARSRRRHPRRITPKEGSPVTMTEIEAPRLITPEGGAQPDSPQEYHDHPYVWAWNVILGATSRVFIERECLAAERDGAPPDAVYKTRDDDPSMPGEWLTVGMLTNAEQQRRVREYAHALVDYDEALHERRKEQKAQPPQGRRSTSSPRGPRSPSSTSTRCRSSRGSRER